MCVCLSLGNVFSDQIGLLMVIRLVEVNPAKLISGFETLVCLHLHGIQRPKMSYLETIICSWSRRIWFLFHLQGISPVLLISNTAQSPSL